MMEDRKKIILDAYKKGPESCVSLFEETFSSEKRIQELETRLQKKTLQIVITTFSDGLRKTDYKNLRKPLMSNKVASWADRHNGLSLTTTPDHTITYSPTHCTLL